MDVSGTDLLGKNSHFRYGWIVIKNWVSKLHLTLEYGIIVV